MQFLQGAKIIAQLFWMWFYVNLLHATRCNNLLQVFQLVEEPAIVAACRVQ